MKELRKQKSTKYGVWAIDPILFIGEGAQDGKEGGVASQVDSVANGITILSILSAYCVVKL